jgi:hypothetical protein
MSELLALSVSVGVLGGGAIVAWIALFLLRVHAAKRAKPRTKNINIFSMADLLSGQQAAPICSGQKQWEKTKRKGRCHCHASGEGQGQNYGCLFHGNPLFQLCGGCQNRARTSVTAITFWSFYRPALIRNLIFVAEHAPHKQTVLVLRIDDPEFFHCCFQRWLCSVGGFNPDEWDFPPKPKWMRWRTYKELASPVMLSPGRARLSLSEHLVTAEKLLHQKVGRA